MAEIVTVTSPRVKSAGSTFWASAPSTSFDCRSIPVETLRRRINCRRLLSPIKASEKHLKQSSVVLLDGQDESSAHESDPKSLSTFFLTSTKEEDDVGCSDEESDLSDECFDVEDPPEVQVAEVNCFAGEHAKSEFLGALKFSSVQRYKSSVFKYQLPGDVPSKITECTGIQKLKPLSPRAKIISLFESNNLVPEPLLIRASQEQKTLALQHLGLGNSKCSILFSSLPLLTGIHELNIENNNLNQQSLDGLLFAAKQMPCLARINLSRNKVSPSAISGLADLIKVGRLQQVTLSNCQINGVMANDFGNIIAANFQMAKLNELNLEGNKINKCDGIANMLSCYGALKILNLAWNPIKAVEAIKIAGALIAGGKIEKLSLAWCPLVSCSSGEQCLKIDDFKTIPNENHPQDRMSHDDFHPLNAAKCYEKRFMQYPLSPGEIKMHEFFGNILQDNQYLQWLDLSNTGFSHVSYLAEGIRNNKSLKHLSLSGNFIPPEEGRAFGDGLVDNHTLVGLHIMIANCVRIDHLGYVYPLTDGSCRDLCRLSYETFDKQTNGMPAEHCWICEGWQEVRFVWTPGVSGGGGRNVSLCLNFEGWRPMKMIYDKTKEEYELYRAVPPGKVKFMFEIDGGFDYDLNKEQESIKLFPFGSKLDVNIISVPHRNIQKPVIFQHAFPRPTLRKDINVGTSKTFEFSKSVFAMRFKNDLYLDREQVNSACRIDIERICNSEGPSKILSDEVDIMKMALITKTSYLSLVSVYESCCKCSSGDFHNMNKNAYIDLLTDCGLLSSSRVTIPESLLNRLLVQADAEVAFTSASRISNVGVSKLPKVYQNEPSIKNIHGLNRNQFIECLYRLSTILHRRLQKSDGNDGILVGNVYDQVVNIHLKKRCNGHQKDLFRTKYVYVAKTDKIFKVNSHELKSMFRKFSSKDMTRNTRGLPLETFLNLCTSCFTVGGKLSHGLSIPFLQKLFYDSKVMQTDELAVTQTLFYTDFLESLCRIAKAMTKFQSLVEVDITTLKSLSSDYSTAVGLLQSNRSWRKISDIINSKAAIIKNHGRFEKKETFTLLQKLMSNSVGVDSEDQLSDRNSQETHGLVILSTEEDKVNRKATLTPSTLLPETMLPLKQTKEVNYDGSAISETLPRASPQTFHENLVYVVAKVVRSSRKFSVRK